MLLKPLEYLNKFNLLNIPYRGVVVLNDDPKKLGRIKCTVEGLIEETDIDKLPWIFPWNPYGLGGNINLSSFIVPEVDSELIIEFPYNNIYSPFYTGYWQSTTTHQTLFDTNYPEAYGFRDSKGNFIKVDKTSGEIKVEHFTGTQIIIEVSGRILINGGTGATAGVMQGDCLCPVTGKIIPQVSSNVWASL